jgi:hypothetical protein
MSVITASNHSAAPRMATHHHPRAIRRENTTSCLSPGTGTPANKPLISIGVTALPSISMARSGVSFSDDARKNAPEAAVVMCCSPGA